MGEDSKQHELAALPEEKRGAQKDAGDGSGTRPGAAESVLSFRIASTSTSQATPTTPGSLERKRQLESTASASESADTPTKAEEKGQDMDAQMTDIPPVANEIAPAPGNGSISDEWLRKQWFLYGGRGGYQTNGGFLNFDNFKKATVGLVSADGDSIPALVNEFERGCPEFDMSLLPPDRPTVRKLFISYIETLKDLVKEPQRNALEELRQELERQRDDDDSVRAVVALWNHKASILRDAQAWATEAVKLASNLENLLHGIKDTAGIVDLKTSLTSNKQRLDEMAEHSRAITEIAWNQVSGKHAVKSARQ